ncbi:MAG: hypothetical protein ABH896_01805 [Candidatus Jacksonbacteria bacterium]
MLIKLNNRTIKILLLFLSIFAIQSVLLLVLLLRPQISSAAIGVRAEGKSQQVCPCGFKGSNTKLEQNTDKKETIRLFIPIPGVTDGCGYLCDINGDKKGDVVDYVVAIYKFLVGAAAIMAVFMIMVGGYQWIFAMGSSSRIESAKDTIKSALFGLLLTLFSYQVLHFINPRLTDVVLPDVEEIGRMQIGGYLCGGDDLLVNDVNFNTMLVGSFAEALKDGDKLTKTDFYITNYLPPPSATTLSFKIPEISTNLLISGLNPGAAKDILKCDNTAMSYQVPETKGGTTFKNPSGPEVKIAHINIVKVTDEAIGQEVTKISGVDCFYGLCDDQEKGFLDPKAGIAAANRDTLKKYAEQYAKDHDYGLASPVEIYNSVSTRVEPKGGGCYGSFCDPAGEGLTLCLSRSGMGIGCWNISQMCKDTDKNMCEETDQILQASIAATMNKGVGGLPIECGTMNGQGTTPDKCYLGAKFSCPFGYPQLQNIYDSVALYNKSKNDDGCWELKNEKVQKHDCWDSEGKIKRTTEFRWGGIVVNAVDYGLAIDQVSAVCCQEKTQGVCFPDFGRAYEHQTFKYLKEICDNSTINSKCSVKTTYNYEVEWTGTCQPQTGFVDKKLVENALVCMLPTETINSIEKPTAKVCHLGKKDKVMYEQWEACASRAFIGAFAENWFDFALTNKFDCESYILPSDYPCLDLPAAGEFKEGTDGTGEGGDTGDITGKVDNIVAYLESHPEVKDAIKTKAQALQVLPDWPFQSFPVGLVGSAPIVPMNTVLASGAIDASKFVEVLMAREIGGYKLDDPQKPPEKFCSPNDGTVDCGLMQVNSQIPGTCPNTCEDLGLFDIDTNIQTGIAELVNYFTRPSCGSSTSCQLTVDDVDGLKRYRWIYMITGYNGGITANADSESCMSCPSGQPADRCSKISDSQQGCFIGKVDAKPTKVECPYNDSCGIEDGEYRTITYSYVLDMIEGYKHLTE